jgi:hypothetical protein
MPWRNPRIERGDRSAKAQVRIENFLIITRAVVIVNRSPTVRRACRHTIGRRV